MNQEFASDLNNARLESSLSYEDCVHLLDMTVKRFKQLERGSVIPTLNELCALNILFNQAFESLYNDIFDEVKAHMHAALENMPGENEPECSDITRQTSLNSLSERLQGFRIGDYGS
jgi:transcriptional regulator with XRE-family HTH domain